MRAQTYDSKSVSNTTHPELAVDELDETAAVLSPVVGSALLRVAFTTTVQQGEQATLLLKSSGNLDASLLSNIAIRTYLSSSQTPGKPTQEMMMDDQAVKVSLLQAGSPISKATFTVEKHFDRLELQVGGIAGGLTNISSSVSVYSVYATVSPLPVQLTAFQGKATPAGVALTWETASEQHNDHFVVERADGSPEAFRALSEVAGAGTCTQSRHYQLVDAAPAGQHYYRLRQVDTDGKESFSPVVVVKTEPTGAGLAAYPSPATEALTVTGPAGTRFGVFNQLGQQVRTADVAPGGAQQLDVRSLPGGVYFLREASTGRSTRFVKAEN